jgi:predicted HTH transcriptional regulator
VISFTNGLTVEKLLSGDYRSSLRNRKIADMFKEIGLVEKYGSGIGRIIQAFKDYGLPEPKFQEISDSFMVTAYATSSRQIAQDKSSVKSSVKILEAIQQNKSVTAVELSQLLGLTLRAVEKQLAKLKQEGVLLIKAECGRSCRKVLLFLSFKLTAWKPGTAYFPCLFSCVFSLNYQGKMPVEEGG